MTDSFFYSQIEVNSTNRDFLAKLEEFSITKMKQVYIINKSLSEQKYHYEYPETMILLIPKYKIIFFDFELDNYSFEEYMEEFIEDLGYLSDKYDYKKVLGRPKKWRDILVDSVAFKTVNDLEIEEFLESYKLKNLEEERNGEFLISLLTGSINDVVKIGSTFPLTLLDKVKQKIVLFDGDQTRFIYEEPTKRRVIIQGLAGTGKTELLLHKLKELYINPERPRIAFTCHNKILADSLRDRIPNFFNFMRVDEQIKWNSRLWTFSSWGSKSDGNSGFYSYVCKFYNLNFRPFSYNSTFDFVCKKALEELNNLENVPTCFDYVLIDESQDFPESFFLLCEKVTSKTIYIAGDIFQNIFEDVKISEVNPDFLLNKCYRTDPRTLMFAHGFAMGLFGSEKLRWLEDEEWEACGYIIKKNNGYYDLSRKPLRRFEDLEAEKVDSLKIVESNLLYNSASIMSIIENLIKTYPTITPNDIAIVFLENIGVNYNLANELTYNIKSKFGWEVNLGYETKSKIENTLFISNRNNIKGLEFPFMICVTNSKVEDDLQKRNSIYMLLTRSFITTYFIISDTNKELIPNLIQSIKYINENESLHVKEPSDREKERLRNAIITNPALRKTQYEIVEEIMDSKNYSKDIRKKMHKLVELMLTNEFDVVKLNEFIEMNYNYMAVDGD